MNIPYSYKTIIRFDKVTEQSDGAIKRVVGFIYPKNLLSLLDDATLDANPRSAKVNAVTNDIITSVREDPNIFQFKTRGILLGTSDYSKLDRNRYELRFNNPAYEGLLDGGHNMLALGIYLLSQVMDEKDIKKLKLWEDMKVAWNIHRKEVKAIMGKFDFKVPVELLIPSDMDNDEVEQEFQMALIDICAARNNNAQLTTEAKANQRGFYDEIRKRMPNEIVKRVEWKTNEWEGTDPRPIKIRDLIALAWIPLTVLKEQNMLPTGTEKGTALNFSVMPQNIYRNKAELSKLFDKLMEHPDVSKAKGGPQHELHNVAIGSAFDVLADLPYLYDYIFVNMGNAYNKSGGSFGHIKAVKIPKRGKVHSPFLHEEANYRPPDGFVIPILYGLKALMKVEDGKVMWQMAPKEYISKHLHTLVGAFKLPLEMASFDPQKVAKNENTYVYMVGEVEKTILKHPSTCSYKA